MDKAQAIYQFWSSFGLNAYDENSLPDDAVMPYITYQTVTDSLDKVVPMSASIWYRSTSWADCQRKAEAIAKAIAEKGFVRYPVTGGYVWITKGTPFAQRVPDTSDLQVKRMYLNITAEYLTAY